MSVFVCIPRWQVNLRVEQQRELEDMIAQQEKTQEALKKASLCAHFCRDALLVLRALNLLR